MFISRKIKLLGLIICLLASFQLRAEITFTPAEPVVEMEEKIEISVSGTVGELTWSAQKGWIEGTGTTVKYSPPSQPGWDVVTVMDAEANVATLKIQINPKPKKLDFSHENAVWEVFTNRDDVRALALSKDKTTLWVGSYGGLEKRKASTGELEKVYLKTDGLPDNRVNALIADDQGGVWIGTVWGGLAHLKANGSWQIFNTDNSELPNNQINALLLDKQGGVWIGTGSYGKGGLVHLKANDSWQTFNKDNSTPCYKDIKQSPEGKLFLIYNPSLYCLHIEALLSDEEGGLWVGTRNDFIHLRADGSIQTFNKNNSNLPFYDKIKVLLSDGQGGIWIGTSSGLIHLTDDRFRVFNKDNSIMPHNYVKALISDEQGGIWFGTGSIIGADRDNGGLVHLKSDGYAQIFNTDNSNLPYNVITSLSLDAQGNVWVGTQGYGLACLKAEGSWQVFNADNADKDNTDNLNLPYSNYIEAIASDEQGGIWIGTQRGLVQIKSDDSWQAFNMNNSNLPHNFVKTLISDKQGGLWLGTNSAGLVQLKNDGSWHIFNTDNSNFPHNSIEVLLLDEQDKIWIGTRGGGLAHLKADDSWQVFNTDNSNLPHNEVKALLSDAQGGVWIGTKDGLAHLKADRSWQAFNRDNSILPNNYINSILLDAQGGILVGTSRGLAYLKADGSWQVFNKDNSNLPHSNVNALLSDRQGGAWVGTVGGLAHINAEGFWQQAFNMHNSNLLHNNIRTLLSDDQGGLWVGTDAGIAHIKPGEQQSGKRAAIIIAGGGNQSKNTLWDTTESISTYFYKMLNKRKFVNSEIYYLSSQPWADFNGDGFDDRIVDAPRPARQLTLDDVKKAFEWAKEQGKLEQPLYLFFIDHGGDGKLQLAKNTTMSAQELKTLLDDYQQATGNQVVLILEACYSGSFLPLLAAPNRAIISSAKANELAYFENEQGFSRFFTQNLLRGMSFLEAFDYSVQQQSRLLAKMDERLSGGAAEYIASTQTPQCDDNGDGVYDPASDGQWLKQLKINGDIQTADFTLAVDSLTTSTSLQVGQPFSLSAKASTASGHIKRVWAVIRPPRINLVIDSNGTPILAYPTQELSQTEDKAVWTGSWNQALYNGDYEISFYAKDNEGNIEMSEQSVVISVNGGIDSPSSASVEVVIEKDRYTRGESFQFQLVEQLGWGYDLYAAVVLPDGGFITLEGPNQFAQLNQTEKWHKPLKYNEKVTAIDMTLPPDLALGTYCLYGILSPQGENPLDVRDKWVSAQQCFDVM